MHRVFIYGTLKRGFPNHRAGLRNASYLGRFRTQSAFPLVVGGRWFSPYLLHEPGTGHRVFGEVFEVGNEGLATLDQMEGTHLPMGYRRIVIRLSDGADNTAFEAWTYVKDRETIEGIHTEAMEEYLLDPRYVIPAKRTRDF